MSNEESKHHGLDTDERVCFYEQDFYPLSNFSSFAIDWKSIRFPTSEHVYHFEKFEGDPHVQSLVLQAASAHAAFKLAEYHRAFRRPDWDDVKVDVMRNILRAKVAQHEYVRRKLIATGERELVENSWRDSFWGWGPNRDGRNVLGKLWMEIRAELRGSAIGDVAMSLYRSKHAVEAMQWDGTAECRKAISVFVERKTGKSPWFRDGTISTIMHFMHGTYQTVCATDWVVWTNSDLTILTDAQFRAEYEEVTSSLADRRAALGFRTPSVEERRDVLASALDAVMEDKP